MKNKKMVYILLSLSVVVWGGVFVRLYGVFVKDDATAIRTINKVKGANYKPEKDTFELLANYKDPFFKKSMAVSYYNGGIAASPKSTGTARVVKKEVKEVIPIDWSFIQFKGTIKRKTTGRAVSLLSIRGKEYFLEDGNSVEEVLVSKNCKDSVLVKYAGVNKYIKRN